MEATGGTTLVVDGDALTDELAALDGEPPDSVPPAVEVTVVSADSEPLLHPASRAIIATNASTTVSSAFFRAAIIVFTAPSQDFRGQEDVRATAAELPARARVTRTSVLPV
jgi:hypothetical protein